MHHRAAVSTAVRHRFPCRVALFVDVKRFDFFRLWNGAQEGSLMNRSTSDSVHYITLRYVYQLIGANRNEAPIFMAVNKRQRSDDRVFLLLRLFLHFFYCIIIIIFDLQYLHQNVCECCHCCCCRCYSHCCCCCCFIHFELLCMFIDHTYIHTIHT